MTRSLFFEPSRFIFLGVFSLHSLDIAQNRFCTEFAFLGSEPCSMTVGFRLRTDSLTHSYFPCHHLGQSSSKAAQKAPKLAPQGPWNDLVPRVPVVQIEFFLCLGGTASVHFAICGFSMTSYAESAFLSFTSSEVSVGSFP